MVLGFGWKARIGQLYPSGGLCDYEPQVMAPEGVQFLTTRLGFRKAGLEDDAAVARDLEPHAKLLADAQVQLVAFNCTAASLVAGPDVINRRITDATGIPLDDDYRGSARRPRGSSCTPLRPARSLSARSGCRRNEILGGERVHDRGHSGVALRRSCHPGIHSTWTLARVRT